MKMQNIIRKVLCTFVVLTLVTNNVYALTKDIVSSANAVEARSVFENDDGGEYLSVYVDFSLYDYGNIRYVPLDTVIRITAPYNTNGKLDLSRESFTVEQQDRYNYKNVYYSVWNSSKKLRVNGHDCQLKYPAIFFSDGEWNYSDYGEPMSMVFLSIDDIAALYGYDVNYWAEKNTYYYKRNGRGYLQTCTIENAPKASSSTSSSSQSSASTPPTVKYTCYAGSKIPDFGAITGRSGYKNASGSIQGVIEQYSYYNVVDNNVASYVQALQASGFTGGEIVAGNVIVGNYEGYYGNIIYQYNRESGRFDINYCCYNK